MNITASQLDTKNQTKNTDIAQGLGSLARTKNAKESEKAQGIFLWDKKSGSKDSFLVKDKNAKEKSIMDSIDDYDKKNSKNFMVVMSNTMSGEDYAKLQEEGGSIADVDSKDMVTIMDEIKVTLAKAGVRVAGFTDDLSDDALANAGINAGYASAISHAMEATNIPVTEDNIKAISSQMEMASQITELGDGAKQYLLQNDFVISIDSLYKASFIGKGQNIQETGAFGISTDGYMTKSGTNEDLKSMESQIMGVIEKTGLEDSEKALQDAYWLLEKGLPLTSENLMKLAQLNQISFPMDLSKVAMAAADGISVGLDMESVDLSLTSGIDDSEFGYIKTAISVERKTIELTDENLKATIAKNKNINLYNLFAAKSDEVVELTSSQNEAFLNARKELTNIQLLMSAQANLKLMKMGIHIDLEPLEKLSIMLEKQEAAFHSTELADVLSKTDEIKTLPVETIGVSVKEAWMANRVYTLNHVYETGKSIAATYMKADASYEAMMTAPRTDLGDSIKTAFRNVDDILTESNMAITEDNERAVRICGYNQMEINEENINAIKEAHALLDQVVSKLTPDKALLMIREGVNPMTMNLDELANYLSSKEDASENVEKYSKFLYRLEKNNEITAEEKDAYIGIYRLLRQIEKGDEAALGSVIKKGQDLGFESLLSAIRTKKFGHLDSKIDDAFGLLSDIQKNSDSITDQLASYFNMKAGNLADEMSSSSEGLTMVDELNTEDMAESLASDNMSVTINSLVAENVLNSSENVFSKLMSSDKKIKNGNSLDEKFKKITTSFAKGKDALMESIKDATFEMEEVVEDLSKDSDSYIDVRAYAVDMKQISLVRNHAESESYYVPMEINEELTVVHIKLVNSEEKGRITIDLKGNEDGSFKAKMAISVKENKIDALVGVYRKEDVDFFSEITKNCEKELQNEGKTADISCVFSNTMTFDHFNTEGVATSTTKELYEVAQVFLNNLKGSR